MTNKLAIGIGTALLSVSLLAGCGNNAAAPASGGEPSGSGKPSSTFDYNQTATIVVNWKQADPTKETDAQKERDALLKKKFPNVTIEYSTDGDLDKMIAAGQTPDILSVTIATIPALIDKGIAMDLNPLVKANNIDLNLYPDGKITYIKAFGPNGELYGIPDSTKKSDPYTIYALLYNKDIFDKFAVPYPKDNMTWDQVIDLAQRLTRTDGGTSYEGLAIQNYAFYPAFQLGLNFVTKDGKADLSDKRWIDLLQMNKDYYTKLGDYVPPAGGYMDPSFLKDKNVAMYAGNAGALLDAPEKYEGELNWDMATYPIFNGMKKGTVVAPNGGMYTVSATSKHKDLAMQIIKYMMSDEMLKDQIEKTKNPLLLKRHYQALENTTPGFVVDTNKYYNKYNPPFRGVLQKAIDQMNKENLDVNTTLRNIQENLQATIDKGESK